MARVWGWGGGIGGRYSCGRGPHPTEENRGGPCVYMSAVFSLFYILLHRHT